MPHITFIEPASPDLHIFSHFLLPRLGSIILATLLKEKGYEVSLVLEEIRKTQRADWQQADLVAISTITSTAPRAYALAQEIRKHNVPVIMGGPHVTFLPDEALRFSDFVIRGEGELAFPRFVETFFDGRNWAECPGLSYRLGDHIQHNPVQKPVEDLDTIPFPDFDIIDEGVVRRHFRGVVPILTSRGCPYDCTFCSVTKLFGRKYRFRSVDNVIAELKFRVNQGHDSVFFYDDNFTARREHTVQLLQRIAQEKLDFRWSAQVRADVAREPDLLGLMRETGCHTVFVGFESVNPDSLKEMHKSQTSVDVEQSIRTIHQQGISIHGMFVLGFDSDTPRSMMDTVRFAIKKKISSVQFLILTPFPGTVLFQRLKSAGRILMNQWQLYDGHHVVFRPVNLGLAQLQKFQVNAHRQFYSLVQIVRRFLRRRYHEVFLAFYARHINRRWMRTNRWYIRLLEKNPQVS